MWLGTNWMQERKAVGEIQPFLLCQPQPKVLQQKKRAHLFFFLLYLRFSAKSDWNTLMGNEVKCGPAIQAQTPFQLKAGAH